MNSFTENIYYQKAKKIKPRRFIFLFIIFLVFFISQLTFVYLVFIPKILTYYEKFPFVQEHIRIPLKSIASLSTFWSIMLIGFFGGIIIYVWKLQKLIANIDNYRRQKSALSMNSFTENIFYKRAKTLTPRGYIFSFIIFLIGTISQPILIYLLFIPKIFIPYEKFQNIQEHLLMAFERIAYFSFFWQIMLLTFNVIMIYYVKNTKKLVNSFENYRKV